MKNLHFCDNFCQMQRLTSATALFMLLKFDRSSNFLDFI